MSTGSSDPPLLMSSPARASRPRSGERALRLPPACAHSRYELRELHWVANLCGLRAPLRAFGSNRTHNLDRIQKVETSSKNTRAPTTAKSKALEHRPPLNQKRWSTDLRGGPNPHNEILPEFTERTQPRTVPKSSKHPACFTPLRSRVSHASSFHPARHSGAFPHLSISVRASSNGTPGSGRERSVRPSLPSQCASASLRSKSLS
jgi:hypothetical protein